MKDENGNSLKDIVLGNVLKDKEIRKDDFQYFGHNRHDDTRVIEYELQHGKDVSVLERIVSKMEKNRQ